MHHALWERMQKEVLQSSADSITQRLSEKEFYVTS